MDIGYLDQPPNMQSINQPQMMQQPMPLSSDEIYAHTLQEDRVKNVLAQISPDNQLIELQWRIKGYVKDPLSGIWEKIEKDTPEPSPLLVARFISYLSSILNQNTSLTNLSAPEINNIMGIIIKWVVDDLDTHQKEYNLEGQYQEMTRIGHILLNNTFFVLKRAQNGMESKRIFSALNMNENQNPNMPQKKQGFFDFLKQ